MNNITLQILLQLEREHLRFLETIPNKTQVVVAYLQKNEDDPAPETLERFCEYLNLDLSSITTFDTRALKKQNLLINSGTFYDAFRNIYLLDSIGFLQHSDGTLKEQSPPSIPIIIEQFTGSVAAISLDTIGPSAFEGGGIIAFDMRLPLVITTLLVGATMSVFQHKSIQGNIAPMGSLLLFGGEIEQELRANPNKAWLLNSLLVSLVNDSNPHMPPLPKLNEQELAFYSVLQDIVIHYLVAHEYAHICSGHHTFKKPIQSGLENLYSRFPNDHNLEFEADNIALSHLFLAAERNSLPLSMYLPYLIMFFVVLGISEDVVNARPAKLTINTLVNDKTHPHAMQRVCRILVHIGALADEKHSLVEGITPKDCKKLFEVANEIYSILLSNFVRCMY